MTPAMTVEPTRPVHPDDVRMAAAAPRPRRSVSRLAVSFERHGEVMVVRLEGNLDIYTVPALRSRLRRASLVGRSLVLDLRALTLLDSSGLGVLIALRNRAIDAGSRLGLAYEDGRLRDVLVIAGLDQAFIHARDVETACSLVCAPARVAPR